MENLQSSQQTDYKKYLGFATGMLLCLGAGFFAGKMGISAAADLSKITVITLALLFIPLFFIVIAVHEAGHALAGVWVNFDFRLYVVGPFMWEKEQDGWRFKWNKNVNTAGGLVLCLPTGTADLPKRFSIYAAGGPVASILLAAIGYVLFRLLSPADITGLVGQQILVYGLALLAFLSLIIFISTALPFHMNGFSSDGARVLRLLKGGDAAKFDILILKIITASSSGIRPKLLDRNELTEAQALAIQLNAPFGVYLHSFFHQVAFDRGDLDAAEQHLLDYIGEADRIPAGLRNIVWLDAAFFYAFARHDLQQATHYWEQFKPTALIPKAQVLATEAAISFLKNETDLAASKLTDSLRELPNMMDRGVAVALADKLRRTSWRK